MDIQDINPNQYADIFGLSDNKITTPSEAVKFGMQETSVDLFASSTTETTTLAPVNAEAVVEEKKEEEKREEVDILTTPEEEKKNTYPFSDLAGYFEDRLKAGKFIAINDEGENGEKIPFIPKTPEEFDEVIDIQVNYKLEQQKEELNKNWYESKSPAWKAVAQYAEMVDDPTEVVPFLQGIQTIQKISGIDEKEIEGAEQIVRLRLQQTKQPQDIIDTQVEALKTTDKLISTAERLKPVMVQEEQQRLVQMQQEEQQRVQQYYQMVDDIQKKAVAAIETPIGRFKLTQDEKAILYDLIAVPSEKSKGYGIYEKIDELYSKGDFDTLRQVGLLLGKKESYNKYFSATIAAETAGKLQRKLSAATESKTGTTNDYHEEKVVSRKQYSNTAPRFGRG